MADAVGVDSSRGTRRPPRTWSSRATAATALRQRVGRGGSAVTTDLTPRDLLVVQTTLEAGAAPADALRATGAVALRGVIDAVHVGVGLQVIAAGGGREVRPGRAAGATSDPAAIPCAADLPPAAAALVRAAAVAEVVGAPAGPAVRAVLDAVRADLRLQNLVRIRSAQAVMSARFLISLPLAAAVALALLDAGARTLMTSAIGMLVTAVALGLIGLAAWWMRRLLGGIGAAGSVADPLVEPTGGVDPVLVATLVTGVAATLLGGPVAGAVTAVLMRLGGPVLLRRARRPHEGDTAPGRRPPGGPSAQPDGSGRPRAAAIQPSRPGGLPTVEAIELVALALTAGAGLAEACGLAARLGPVEVRPAMAAVAGRLRSGATPVQAFPAQLAELAGLIDITHRWGAPTAEALRLLAGDLRDRAATAAEEAAEGLAVRLVFPTTLLLVPAFGLLVVAPGVASTIGSAVAGG